MTERFISNNVKELAARIIYEIRHGLIGAEDHKLASEPELIAHYNTTRYCLRRALSQLAGMGYIYQAHGIGTFVRPERKESSIGIQNQIDLAEELRLQGHSLKTERIDEKVIRAKQAVFSPSGIKLDPNIFLIDVKRFRTLDGKPYLLEHSYFLKDIVGQIPDKALKKSIFEYLKNDLKLKVGFSDKTISADFLSFEEAGFFSSNTGAPSLVVRDDSFLNSGKLFVFSRLVYDYRQTNFFMFKKLR